MDKARIIKDTLNILQVANDYGMRFNRAGKASCPFHSEKTASFGINEKKKYYKCFGCGEGGDVISLTMKLFNITFQQAITRLSHDYRLNLTSDKPDYRYVNSLRKKEAEKKKKHQEWIDKANEFRTLTILFDVLKPNPFDELSDEFIEVMNKRNMIEGWLLENL